MPNSARVSFSHGGRLYLQKPQKAYRHLRLPITNYQLPITNYQLPITNYQLPITGHTSPLRERLYLPNFVEQSAA